MLYSVNAAQYTVRMTMESNKRHSLWLSLRNTLSRKHTGIGAYTRLGIVSYYTILVMFTVLDKVASSEGLFIMVGRGWAVGVVVLIFINSTRKSTKGEIEAVINGGDTGSYADLLWRQTAPVLFCASLFTAAYYFYKGDVWGGALYLGYPAWECWLRLELHRKLAAAGVILPWPGWRIIFDICVLGFLSALLMTLFDENGGPFIWRALDIRLYPAMIIVSMVGGFLAAELGDVDIGD